MVASAVYVGNTSPKNIKLSKEWERYCHKIHSDYENKGKAGYTVIPPPPLLKPKDIAFSSHSSRTEYRFQTLFILAVPRTTFI